MHMPEHSGDEQVYREVFDYFQKVGNIDEIKSQNSTVVNVADTVIQEAMGFVMTVTAIIMAVVFVRHSGWMIIGGKLIKRNLIN